MPDVDTTPRFTIHLGLSKALLAHGDNCGMPESGNDPLDVFMIDTSDLFVIVQ
jgi:hypothetical protein